MARKQEIDFIIKANGTVEYEIKGIKGSGCEGVAAAMNALGKITRDERTREYYERPNDARIVGHQG